MPAWLKSFRVCRVSSQATRSTSFKIRNARRVISSRFPMGVATRYNLPCAIGSPTTAVPQTVACVLSPESPAGGCLRSPGSAVHGVQHFPDGAIDPHEHRPRNDVVADVELLDFRKLRDQVDVPVGQSVTGQNAKASLYPLPGCGFDLLQFT